MDSEMHDNSLKPYVSPLGAWAMALGTSIGWGSLVVTSNTYLLQAGPWGSLLGMLVGAIVMLIISRNYHYMINCFPSAGGAYAYAKETFGYDHGFLMAWFLGLTYVAMFWANVSSLPLFARYFLGDLFQFGFSYTVFGYEVYLGEALLSMAAIVLIALLCMRRRKATINILIGLVLLFSVGITVCFVASMLGWGKATHLFDPGFVPDKHALSQVLRIACISPWAFIGFENISHASEEYTFPRSRVFRILVISVLTTMALYVFVLLLSASAFPAEYSTWLEYIRDISNLDGIKGLPAFYAAYCYLGNFGVGLLMCVLLALIITSLIGNILALSRLLFALSRDAVIPERFARLNERHIPAAAIALIALFSLAIPFLGRTAIGWIVDVTTIGATIIYGFVSASTLKLAGARKDSVEKVTGMVGIILMVAFGAYLLLPSLFMRGSLERESYFLFVVWGILGFVFFRRILSKDASRRFGQSVIVWIALLSLVLFVAFIWMSQSIMTENETTMAQIHSYYLAAGASASGVADDSFITQQMAALKASNIKTMLVIVGLFIFSLASLLWNFSYISKRAQESEEKLGHARSAVNRDPLTGVKSKYAYTENENALDAQIEAGEVEDFAIAVCDVNGLKHVNDTFGHKAGDEYIRSACSMVCELFQHSPVFRVGGDEFVVIMTGKDYHNRSEIMKALNERSLGNIASGDVVVAGGVAGFVPGQDANVRAVFDRADAEMYRNKKMLKENGSVSR